MTPAVIVSMVSAIIAFVALAWAIFENSRRRKIEAIHRVEDRTIEDKKEEEAREQEKRQIISAIIAEYEATTTIQGVAAKRPLVNEQIYLAVDRWLTHVIMAMSKLPDEHPAIPRMRDLASTAVDFQNEEPGELGEPLNGDPVQLARYLAFVNETRRHIEALKR